MKASRFLGTVYLNAEMLRDIPEDKRTVTISHVTDERIQRDRRLVLHFQEAMAPLPLIQTRLRQMITIAGGEEETNEWRGIKVRLVIDDDVMFNDKQVSGIRLEAAQKGPS